MKFIGNNFYNLLTIMAILVAIVLLDNAMAKPLRDDHKREKRSGISDQRLAELETLLELKRLRENLRTRTPIAYGLIDPAKIGRRRKREQYLRTNYFDKLLTRERMDRMDRMNRMDRIDTPLTHSPIIDLNDYNH